MPRHASLAALVILLAGCGELDIGNNNVHGDDDYDDRADGCADWGDEDEDDWGDEPDDGEIPECLGHSDCLAGEYCSADSTCDAITPEELPSCGEAALTIDVLATDVSPPSAMAAGSFDGGLPQGLALLHAQPGAIERIDAFSREWFEHDSLAEAHSLVSVVSGDGEPTRLLALGEQVSRIDLSVDGGEVSPMDGPPIAQAAAARVGSFANYAATFLGLHVPGSITFYRIFDSKLIHAVNRPIEGQLVGRVGGNQQQLRVLQGSEVIDVTTNAELHRGSAFPAPMLPLLVSAAVDSAGTTSYMLAEVDEQPYLARWSADEAPKLWALSGFFTDIARFDDASFLLTAEEGPAQLLSLDDPAAGPCLVALDATQTLAGLDPVEVDLDGDAINELVVFQDGELLTLLKP